MSADASPPAGRAVETLAPAKLNLVLEVMGRREDGYHELDTVMTTIDLADTVRVSDAPELEVVLSGPGVEQIPVDNELASGAARALADAAGREPQARIEITKRLPVSAGLGGGSSDAAAVLRALNRLWDLDWPVERLEPLAAALGSDVPFFLHGGVARCTGRGERVEPLRDMKPLQLLVLQPSAPQRPGKTARRFGALRASDFSDGKHARRAAHRLARGAPAPVGDLVNTFEAVIERTDSELVAEYAAFHVALRGGVTPRLHLTGAGPCVFLLVGERARVTELRRELEGAGARVYAARTLPRAQAIALREAGTGEPGAPRS